MKKSSVFATFNVLLSAVVGAGFVSGKEILSFLGGNTLLSPLIFAVFFTALLLILAKFSTKANAATLSEFSVALFRRGAPVFQFVMLLCFFIVTTTCLVGINDFFAALFGTSPRLPVYSFATALLCGVIVRFGISGLQKVGAVALPFIVLFLVYAAFSEDSGYFVFSAPDVSGALSYGLFSAVMSSGVLCAAVCGKPFRQSARAILLCGIALFLLCVLQLYSLERFGSATMPILEKNASVFFRVAAAVAIYFATVTSVLANAYPIVSFMTEITGDDTLSVALTFFLSLLFSFLGFDFIVKYFYPVISVIGTVLLAAVFVQKIKEKRNVK